jgi:Mg/Co/Ni transporter MgtE
MTNEEQLAQLMSVVNALAATVMHHDNKIEAHDRQIEAIVAITKDNSSAISRLVDAIEQDRQAIKDLTREWQAYLRRLPPQ